MTLILSMDFTCNVDLFLVACKVRSLHGVRSLCYEEEQSGL